MITNFSLIKFFFFLFIFFSFDTFALNYPKPQARPEIKKKEFHDVFEQIRKQNWIMAITLADDYNNRNLSSYIRWLDITRPGSQHNFDYLTNFPSFASRVIALPLSRLNVSVEEVRL